MRTRPRFSHIHQSMANICPTFRRRSAKQAEYLSAVSPRCLEPQEAQHSLHGHLNIMRGSLYVEPPPNVARGASSGGRLGGRPYWHLSLHCHLSLNCHPLSKNLTYKKPSNASFVRPHPRPDRENTAETTTETFTAGNYAEITTRGWGQHQTFVRRHSARRLYKPCLTPFPNVASTPPSFHFPDKATDSPMYPPVNFRLMTHCAYTRTHLRFSHIRQSMANIRTTFHAHAAKQDAQFPA